MESNTEAPVDSTQMDEPTAEVNSQTEEALLADIIANSEFVDTLPNEQVPELDAEDSDEEDPEEELDDDNDWED